MLNSDRERGLHRARAVLSSQRADGGAVAQGLGGKQGPELVSASSDRGGPSWAQEPGALSPGTRGLALQAEHAFGVQLPPCSSRGLAGSGGVLPLRLEGKQRSQRYEPPRQDVESSRVCHFLHLHGPASPKIKPLTPREIHSFCSFWGEGRGLGLGLNPGPCRSPGSPAFTVLEPGSG